MKNFNKVIKFCLIFILIICTVGFVRIFFDSTDIDYFMGIPIYRSLILNSLTPILILPIFIFISCFLVARNANYLRRHRKESRFTNSLKYYHPIIWWIPFLHFLASLTSLKMIQSDAEQVLDKVKVKKLRSAIRWINTSFVLFLTLVFIGMCFNYVNHNKDSNDFFLNMLFLYLIVASIGFIKFSISLSSIELN